jgi:hypothetical protein
MQSVKVRKSGISAEQAADVIRRGLGDDYKVTPEGSAEVLVRKGSMGRAKVLIREEEGGTRFEVRGQGAGFSPLILQLVNARGIARRTAAVIGQSAEYSDDH